MSSCDGVSPIFNRAGADLPEGVTCTPRQGSSQPTLHKASIPTTGGQPTQEPSNLESSAKFPSGRGHHIPAPMWEGCRATLFSLRSCSAVPAGGCRSSGWALVLLAVGLLALVFLAGLWLSVFLT